MKIALRFLLGAIMICSFFGLSSVQAQVLDPADPVVVYNPATPPAQPAWGQIGKWVKSDRLNWNTSNFKAYIYKGMQFRLRFPTSYQHNVNDGKKYPILIFFHGIGEKGATTDNEYQLFHGGQLHDQAVTNGNFDGFLLYPQNLSGYFGASHYDIIKEIIENFMVPQNKVDINRILVGGLSGGGTSTWDFTLRYPLLTAAATPISAAAVAYGNSAGTFKWIPIWHFQGALDNSPHPNTSEAVGTALKNAGANYRYNKYENVGHGCWGNAWAEADYIPFLNRQHKANPWTLYGQTEFCPGETINVTIGVSAGFAEYQWRRNGEAFGGNTNQITATTTGVYECRFRRGTEWSVWSPVPVEIKTKAPTVTPPIQVNGLRSKHIPAPDGSTTVSLQVPAGYTSYDWQRVGNAATLGTANVFNAPSPGNYQVRVTELYGCSSSFSAPFTVIDANGINKPDPAINVLVTPISKTQLRLNWSDNPSPSYDETGFEIYQASSVGGPYTLVAITAANTLTYQADGLSSNSTYYYMVRAVNNTAASAATVAVSGTTMADTQAPTAPTSLIITGTTQNSISLKWNAATDDVSVEKYDIYINGIKSYVTSQTEFVVYNLVYGTTYNFTVKARDFANNASPFSNQVTGRPILSGLAYKYYTFTGTWNNLPNFSTLTPVATGVMPNVALTPRTQDDNFAFLWEGYILIPETGTYYFRTNSDDGSKLWLGSLNGSGSPYSFSGTALVNNDGLHGPQDVTSNAITLTAGVYPIAMAFYEQGGGEAMTVSWRTPSNANFVQIPNSAFTENNSAAGPVPVAPSNLVATAVSYKRINLTWTDLSSNETGFEVWRSTNPTTGFATVGIAAANATTYVDSAVQANTRYYYNIRAIGQYGESAFASVGSGVDYAYYETGQLSNLPDFNALTPQKTGKSATFVLDARNRNDDFAFKFSGYITVPVSGVYTFFTTSDDGSNLYIGAFDQAHRIVHNDYLQGPTERSGTVNLTAGTHPIFVTFFERGGGEVLEVRYQGPAGSGIAKQIIPANVLGIPLPNALTPVLPAVPAAPTALLASGLSNTSINITWTDNATNEEGYELYRSSNNNNNFLLFATLPANTATYIDSGLFPNSVHYYKVRAIGVGGQSAYSNEDSAKTINNLPVITAIPNKSMRFDATVQVNVVATDVDAENLTVQVNNLPAFGSFAATGNGTGVITFTNPGIGQLGNYNIQIVVTDQNSGVANASFTLVVNENYPPLITGNTNVTVAEQQTAQVNLTATDTNAADIITWSFTGMPAFATPVVNGRNVQINLAPGYADNGVYNVNAFVNDGNEGVDQKSFTITVTDVNPNRRVYINFTDGSLTSPAPWNNTNKVPALNDVFSNFKDDAGANSSINLRVTSSWQAVGNGSNVLGVNTGNNSGVYPDNVIRSAYWTDTRVQSIKIQGLNPASKYNFTFFGSRGSVSDNRTTLYTIGSSSTTLNAAANSQNTTALNNLQPNADGTLDLTIRNATGSAYGYLNAMVIELIYEDGTVPAKARNLTAVLDGTNKANLTWVDAAYNETAYQVYSATNVAGPYSLVSGALAANTTAYAHTGLSGNKHYYYYVTATNATGTSASSDTVSVTTPNTAPVLNTIADVNIKTEETSVVNIVATDEPGDIITLSVTGLPSFATFTNTGNGTGTITIAPGTTTGIFNNITVSASDGTATATRQFTITVTDKDISSIYVNFNQVSPVGAPWNSFNNTPIAGRAISNLVNDAGLTTGVAVTLVQQWGGANDVGAITGNNSGVFPDDVMKTAYYEASTNVKTVRISGLNTANKYNLVFFGSRIASDNRNTVYSVGAQSVTLNAAGNTSNTVQINGLSPDVNGVIEFNVAKGSGSPYSYLNALVIQSYVDNGVPLTPSNLTAVGKSKTSIELKWQDKSNNETGFQVYRATEANGTYSLLATVGADVTSYLNQGLPTSSATYYYKVRAVRNTTYSAYSNVAAASTHLFTVSVNFNRDNPAPAPWNNTNNVPQEGSVYNNLVNDLNAPSGIGFEVTDNFSGENPFGMNTGNNSGVYPDNVIRSTWWLDVSDVGKLKVTGLNQSLAYSFIFFASREGAGNRTTLYTINGSSATLNAANNINQTTQIDNIKPDENGEILITVSVPSGSQYGYIGSMIIQGYNSPVVEEGNGSNPGGRVMSDYIVNQAVVSNEIVATTQVQNLSITPVTNKLSATEVSIYPNPFVNYINVSLNLAENQDKVSIRVLDVTGKPVVVKEITGLSKGASLQRIVIPSTLPVGVYMVQVITKENDKLAPKVIKIMKARQ